jgi:hypothetical protein
VGQRRAATDSHETGPGNRAGGGAVSAMDDTGPGGAGRRSARAGVSAITGDVDPKVVPVLFLSLPREEQSEECS